MFAVAFVGGTVKGAIGFAMPLIFISTATLFVDPKIAVAALILPILVSNVTQMLRQGRGAAIDEAIAFWPFIAVLVITIFVTAQFMAAVPVRAMYLFLGGAVTVISAIQLSGWKPVIPVSWRPVATPLFAVFAGAMGGFSGTWGPATVLYMLALDIPKMRQVIAQGVIFGLGGIPLLLGHLQSGILNSVTLPLSFVMIVPVYVGMMTGFRLQDRIDQATFRKATLVVLVLAGANLVRRGIWP